MNWIGIRRCILAGLAILLTTNLAMPSVLAQQTNEQSFELTDRMPPKTKRLLTRKQRLWMICGNRHNKAGMEQLAKDIRERKTYIADWKKKEKEWKEETKLELLGPNTTYDFFNEFDPPQPKIESTFIPKVAIAFCVGRKYGSPLVLDLDGDGGIEVTELRLDSQSFFDIDEDGFAEQIAWVKSDDGLLVRDLNGNGRIDDASELFGSINEDGFTQLAKLDANDDGVVDPSDLDFATLLIWRDTDGDGISSPEELHALSKFAISALVLKATLVNETNAGNQVTHIGTFVVNDNGQTENRAMHDIWFRFANMNSRFIGEISLDDRVSSLPNLRGYGIVPDLNVAMSLGNDGPGSLLERVAQLGQREFEEFFQQDEQITITLQDVLLHWADVSSLAPDSRGEFIDARQLAFLEKLTDEAYIQRGIHSNPFSGAAAALDRLLAYVFDHYYARFMSQVIGEEIFRFENGYTLVPGSKPGMKSAYSLRRDDFEGIIGLKPSGLKVLETIAEAAEEPDYAWDIALRMIEFSVGLENLPPEDLALLSESLLASGASSLATHSMAIQTVRESLDDVIQGRQKKPERSRDTDNDGHLAGSPEDDFLVGDNDDEVLEGGDGDDEIRSKGGNDRLSGQKGSDYLLGGQGDDVYVFDLGDGIDVINEGNDRKGHDILELGEGIGPDDLIFERRGNTDLLITLRDNPLDAVLIENQFNGGSGLEVLRFADGSEEELETRNYALKGTGNADKLFGIMNGGGPDDKIRGLGGNDTILGKFGDDRLDGGEGDDRILGERGNDIIVGGPGNDTSRGGPGNDELTGGPGDDVLDGGPGDDLFRYESGDDRFIDSRGQFDRLIVENVRSTDVSYLRVGRDLKIVLHEGGSLLLVKHFSGAQIETISYSDAEVDSSSVEYTNQGGPGDDRLRGSPGHDTLIGGEGDDRLRSGEGNDSLDGGRGDDVLDSGNGDDVLKPGHGDDVAKGGSGNDRFYYSSGHDRYSDRTGDFDVITLSSHYRSEQVALLRRVDDLKDLKLEINAANSVTLKGHFTANGAFEEIFFEATGDRIDLKTLQPTTLGSADDDDLFGVKRGTNRNDKLFGLAGNDRILAGDDDDWLAGGPGNDRLEGGAGADVYFYAIGDGDDTITETSGNDGIRFGEGIVYEDLVFTEEARDLVIGLPSHANGRLVLTGQLGKANRQIEFMEFADGSVRSLMNLDK